MEILKLQNLSDSQWISYFELLNNVKNKFGEDCFIVDCDWEEFRDFYWFRNMNLNEFKKNRLDFIEKGKSTSFTEYVILDNGEITGWIAFKNYHGDCEFLFDSIDDEFSSELINLILKRCHIFMTDNNKDEVSIWAHAERKKKMFITIGTEHVRESYTSKLPKENLNIESWKEIVRDNEFAPKLKLLFCREIPEKSYLEYIDFRNEVIFDMEFYNPKKPEFNKLTLERLLSKIKADNADEDLYYAYLLYDGEEIAAVCSVYIQRSNMNVLNHGGALTAVSRKHRGKNLAKYLKAKMYLKIIEDFSDFEYAITDTYPWNKYMYRINEEMGFKLYRHEFKYELSKEFLENYLKQ